MEGVKDRIVVGAVLDNDKDGIVARYGAHDLRNVAVVDIVGDAAGIARPRMDNANVAGEVDALEPRHGHHLHGLERRMDAVIHRLVGQHVDVLAIDARCLGHLELFEIAAKRGLRHGESLVTKLPQQHFLTANLFA